MTESSFAKLVNRDQRLQVFNDTVPAGILVLNIDTGEVVFSNRFFNEILGVQGNHVLGHSWENFFFDKQERQSLMIKFIEEGTVRNFELRLRRPDGSAVWGLVSMSDIPIENEDLLLFAFVDITLLKQAEEEIRALANHDELTGLPSLRLLQDRMNSAIARAQRNNTKMAIMFVDLDGFKSVNDTMGHQVGNEILIESAKRMQTCVRDADTVARLGGDEFIIVIEYKTDRKLIENIAQRIVDHIAESITTKAGITHIGASVGIAIYPDNADTPDQLIHMADKAMYVVKNTSKGAAHFA